MKTKHTEGEWVIVEEDSDGHFVIESKNGKTAICYGAGFYGKHNPSKANARLIAAAPELLDALKAVHSTYRTFRNVPENEQQWTSIDDTALAQVENAITKATTRKDK